MPTQNEIRSRINDQILAALSDGTKLPPWRKPWNCSDANAGPACNVVSQRRYTGVNPLLLEIAAHRHGFQSRWWGTFRQWEAMGGRVNRRPDNVPPGRWGTQIVFCRPVTKTQIRDNGEEFEDKFFILRAYTVFNLDQVSGPFENLRVGNAPLPVHEVEQRCEHAEVVMAAPGADLRHGGNRAFYSLTGDYIQLPHRSQFERVEAYYQTAAHELCHWTEHASRLSWDRAKPENSYAMGELIAELGGCYLMGELGLPTGEDLTNHAAYLQSWLAGMQNDTRFIFKAAAQASRAVDFILTFSRTQDGAAEPDEEALVA
jgi:antirestriction protein ArdC